MTTWQLTPDRVPLWRDAFTLQLGAGGDLVLRDPAPWQERVVAALETGIERASLESLAAQAGVGREELDAFLARLRTAVVRVAPPRQLAVIAAAGVPDRVVGDVLDALDGSGWRARWLTPAARVRAETEPIARAPVIVLASHAVPPHLCAALQRDDVLHLPIVFTPAGADIGPLMVPGRTACVSCLTAHERDRDPAWPALAMQLLDRRAPRVPLAIAAEAAALAVRLLEDDAEPGDEPERSRSVRLGARSRRLWRSHRPHAECLCRLDRAVPRSPRGTATAAAASAPSPAPTTATAFARPA